MKQYVVNKKVLARYIAALVVIALSITGLVMLWIRAMEPWEKSQESQALAVTKTAWSSGLRGTPQGDGFSFVYKSAERTFTFRKADTFETAIYKRLVVSEGGICKYVPSYPLVGIYSLALVAAGIALSRRIVRGPKGGRREDD